MLRFGKYHKNVSRFLRSYDMGSPIPNLERKRIPGDQNLMNDLKILYHRGYGGDRNLFKFYHDL